MTRSSTAAHAAALAALALLGCGRIWYDPLARGDGGSDGGRDAGRDGASAADTGVGVDGAPSDAGAVDAGECIPDVPCSVGDTCRAGEVDCSRGTPVCVATGAAPPGTPCPAGVCDGAGMCVPCVEGEDCPTGVPCRFGALECSSGSPVCVEGEVAPPGTPCPGGMCDATGACVVTMRRFTCGWAMSGFGCDNGRASINIMSADMRTAIADCRSMIPATYPDFCYVRNALVGGTPAGTDLEQCMSAPPPPGTWRPASSCCNFMGTLSCP